MVTNVTGRRHEYTFVVGHFPEVVVRAFAATLAKGDARACGLRIVGLQTRGDSRGMLTRLGPPIDGDRGAISPPPTGAPEHRGAGLPRERMAARPARSPS